jgi:hypothetical protein
MGRREELIQKAQREELTAEEQDELQRLLEDVGRTDEGGPPTPGGRIPPPPD